MRKIMTRENVLSFIIVALMCVAIVMSITACGGSKKNDDRNPTLSDPNGTTLTEHILYEETIVEDWDSNVTYWEDVDESISNKEVN